MIVFLGIIMHKECQKGGAHPMLIGSTYRNNAMQTSNKNGPCLFRVVIVRIYHMRCDWDIYIELQVFDIENES